MTTTRTDIVTRRTFLQTTAAAGAITALPSLACARLPPQKEFGGFTVGVQSYTFHQFNLEQTLQQIQKLGLRYVEFYRGHVPTTSTPAQIKAVLGLCRRYNVTPIAFGVERFTNNHKNNRSIFQFARRLGVRHLSAVPEPNSFDSLNRLVHEFNISIAIHPHGPTGPRNNRRLHRWFSAEQIMRAVRKHHRLIGSCLDTGHLIRAAQAPFNRKLDPAQQIRAMGARNFGIHLKDHDNKNRRDVVFGRGPLDVTAVLRALRAVKFAGYISVEYEANPNNPAADVRVCLNVLRAAARRLG